jgi:hypothetical protein
MQMCEKAQELKAEYNERFDASAVIAAFEKKTLCLYSFFLQLSPKQS